MKIPESGAARTFGDWAYVAIAKHYTKILKHETEVLKNTDPEELHQMRVGMRRLRSVLTGFELALVLPKGLEARTVAKIARILGNLRDLDVLEENLVKNYLHELPEAEQQILTKITTKLSKKKAKSFKQVKAILRSNSYHKLKKSFEKWLSNPQYQQIAQIPIDLILPDLLLPQISQLLLHPGWLVGVTLEAGEIQPPKALSQTEVEVILRHQGVILHDLRKEAKRSRYNLELFSHFYGEDYHHYVDQIKEIQTIIGEIQDFYVFNLFFVQNLSHNWTDKLPHLAKQFQDTRYQQWQQWEKLQQQFLNPEIRQDLRLTIQNSIVNGQ